MNVDGIAAKIVSNQTHCCSVCGTVLIFERALPTRCVSSVFLLETGVDCARWWTTRVTQPSFPSVWGMSIHTVGRGRAEKRMIEWIKWKAKTSTPIWWEMRCLKQYVSYLLFYWTSCKFHARWNVLWFDLSMNSRIFWWPFSRISRQNFFLIIEWSSYRSFARSLCVWMRHCLRSNELNIFSSVSLLGYVWSSLIRVISTL